MHRGVVTANGRVDSSKVITDPAALQTITSDDGLHLENFEPGNFEWWYFDIIDPATGCILKIVAHLGTDPLRRKCFPQIALSVKTPAGKRTFAQPCQLDAFDAARDACHVKIGEQFHCYLENSDYHIRVAIPAFTGEFTFVRLRPGWKPLGDEVAIERRKRRAVFGWVIPVPRAVVTGTFHIEGRTYHLNNASGYHDHNFWKVNQTNRLFIDDIISRWYWGRFSAGDYTILFMNTHFRYNRLTSLYIAADKDLIHSSNNIAQFHIAQQKMDNALNCPYPVKSIISVLHAPETLRFTLTTQEVIDRKDLLAGVNPIISYLIKSLIARPAYIGLEVACDLVHADQHIHGTGVLEFMFFR
jgi:hypothetical protein